MLLSEDIIVYQVNLFGFKIFCTGELFSEISI